MSIDRGQGGGTLVQSGESVAIYEAGRLFNELSWTVDQALLLGHGRLILAVEQLLERLAFKVVAALPIDLGGQIKTCLLAKLADWRGMTSSEWFAEELSDARDAIERVHDLTQVEALSGLLTQARIFRNDARNLNS